MISSLRLFRIPLAFLLLIRVSTAQQIQQQKPDCGDKDHIFCWWALDFVTISNDRNSFYYNGKSQVIESNIERSCNETENDRYGISYVDVNTAINYLDYDTGGIGNISTVAEISYYCCNKCTNYKHKSDLEIIEDLLDHYYDKRRQPINNDTDDFCFNSDDDIEENLVDNAPCILILDVNSWMKTYSGPMFWNKIDLTAQLSTDINNSVVALVRKGFFHKNYMNDNCLRYVSHNSYFLLCYCWINRTKCSYEPEHRDLVEKNKLRWSKLLRVRNPQIAAEIESYEYNNRSVDWSYQSFVYSVPGRTIGEMHLISEKNLPLYHCAFALAEIVLQYNETSKGKTDFITITNLPPRTRFCMVTISITFKKHGILSVFYYAKPDKKKECRAVACKYTVPKCLNGMEGILYRASVNVHKSCCCVGDLCNHWGHKFTRLGYQLNLNQQILPADSMPCQRFIAAHINSGLLEASKCSRSFDIKFGDEIFVNEDRRFMGNLIRFQFWGVDIKENESLVLYHCGIYHIHTPDDPYCHRRKDSRNQRPVLQYFNCECDTNVNGKLCDAGMNETLFKAVGIFQLPKCFFTPGFFPVHSIVAANLSEEHTIDSPICAIHVLIGNGSLVTHMKALSYEDAGRVAFSLRYRQISLPAFDHFVMLCQSNQTSLCNSKEVLSHHLLTTIAHRYALKKEPPHFTSCHWFLGGKLVQRTCTTSANGCFIFHHLSGKMTAGCIDKIPTVLKNHPRLLPLATCILEKTFKGDHFCQGYKATTNVTESGYLCCCKSRCPYVFASGANFLESLLPD